MLVKHKTHAILLYSKAVHKPCHPYYSPCHPYYSPCHLYTHQDEMGEHAVTVIVSMDNSAEGGGQVHFEVFQCSAQCVQLAKTGWMLAPQSGVAPSGVTKMVNPSDLSVTLPVIVASKEGCAQTCQMLK
jgi:hypothetical protein